MNNSETSLEQPCYDVLEKTEIDNLSLLLFIYSYHAWVLLLIIDNTGNTDKIH